MSKEHVEGWGVVRVPSGRLAGIFKTQAEALDRMFELSPAYLVCFGNGLPRPLDFFWEFEGMPSQTPVNVVTHH